MLLETQRKRQLEVYKDIDEGRIDQEEGGRRLLEIDPNHGPGMLYLAAARQNAGELDEAEKLMWRALDLMPCRHLPYLSLYCVVAARDPEDPLLQPLQTLTMWKLSDLDEIPATAVELFKHLETPGVDFADPDSFGRIAYEMEEAKDEPEPPQVTEQLLPYRLLNEVQINSDGGLDEDVFDKILENAPRCSPIFAGAVHDAAQMGEVFPSMALIVALSGEISGPEVLDDVIDWLDHNNSDLFNHAHWAAWRLGRRFPEQTLERLRSAISSARLTQLCGIAEQMHLLPDTSGLDAALKETLNRLSEFSNDPDAPHLLAIVAYALLELGLDDDAGEVMRIYQHKLSGKGRKEFKRLIKDKDGYVPRLQLERIDEFDIEQVCCEYALMTEEEDDEDEEEQEPAANQASQPPNDFAVVIRALMDFSHESRSTEQLQEAMRLFFGTESPTADEDRMSGFVEWYLYDFRPGGSGSTTAEEYLKRRGAELTPRRRALLEALCTGRFGLREVLRVEEGMGVELRDVFTGEQIFVNDVSSSKELVLWDCLLNRVFHFEGRSEFPGNGVLVPRSLLERVMQRVREGAEAAGQKPEDYIRATSHQWARVVADMQRESVRDLRVVNFEGDELEFSSATYQVLDEAKVAAALASAKVFEETTSPKDPRGQRNFGWLETGIEGPRRSYGHIEMHHGMLRLECNSRKRLSIGRQLVEKHAGQFLRHLTDQFKSLDEVKESALRSGARPKKPNHELELPRDVKEKILLQHKTKHYGTWPDDPLPALQGRTPREAVRSEVGRRAVEELLRDFENHEERARKQGEPAFDFGPLRKELGL